MATHSSAAYSNSMAVQYRALWKHTVQQPTAIVWRYSTVRYGNTQFHKMVNVSQETAVSSSGKNKDGDCICFEELIVSLNAINHLDLTFTNTNTVTLTLLLVDPQSEAVQTALYGTDWYQLSPAFKRLVPMMLMRARSAVKLRNGIFNDLCFATFSAVSSKGQFLCRTGGGVAWWHFLCRTGGGVAWWQFLCRTEVGVPWCPHHYCHAVKLSQQQLKTCSSVSVRLP